MADPKTPAPSGGGGNPGVDPSKPTMIIRLPKDDYGKIAIEYYDPASIIVPAGSTQPDWWTKEGATTWGVNCGCGGGNCKC